MTETKKGFETKYENKVAYHHYRFKLLHIRIFQGLSNEKRHALEKGIHKKMIS
jgi:hypothetical protein